LNRFLTAIVSLALLCGVADARLLGVNPTGVTGDILCNGGSPTGTNNEICHDYLGDWGPTSVGGSQTLGTSAFPWDGIYLGSNPSTPLPAFQMNGSVSTTTIATTNLGFSEFIAVSPSGAFLALCISTGGVGGSVLVSDGVTACYGATFAAAAGAGSILGVDTFYTLLSTGGAPSSLTLTNSTVSINAGSSGASYTNTASTVTGLAVTPISAADVAAFNAATTTIAAMACATTQTGTLAGATLQPGVACFTAAATLTGVLTLNGGPSSLFVIKSGTGGSGALTGTNLTVVLTGGAKPGNVYWYTPSAATFTDTTISGNILSGTSVTLTRVTLIGRAFAAGTVTGTNVIASAPQ
jgi:hypothetical protein